ncbi:hypothetical protein JNB84_21735 [Rhizobium pusense]|uniref:hypothetical protein n=1 Tax=Agrobacterium pusense TaxID=648995 RepID=UPI001C6E2B6B|nr:hypothetical protein [Agrobacterium pusense]MBW9080589.1 hypothetical protein [Agrobacterium pusense]
MVLVDLALTVVAERTYQIGSFAAGDYVEELIVHILDFLSAHHEKEVWAGGISVPLVLKISDDAECRWKRTRDGQWFSAFWQAMTPGAFQTRLDGAVAFPTIMMNNPQAGAMAEATFRPAGALASDWVPLLSAGALLIVIFGRMPARSVTSF